MFLRPNLGRREEHGNKNILYWDIPTGQHKFLEFGLFYFHLGYCVYYYEQFSDIHSVLAKCTNFL